MSRCSCCQSILTTGEMLVTLPDGSFNDICWSCMVFVDHPEICYTKTYAFEDITEGFYSSSVTKPKALND